MLPPRPQHLLLQVELLPRLAEKAPVPLFRGDGRLAEGGEIEEDDRDALPAKARRRTAAPEALGGRTALPPEDAPHRSAAIRVFREGQPHPAQMVLEDRAVAVCLIL